MKKNNKIDDYQKVFLNKSRILVVMAHPDDAEIVCGGTIARLVKDGREVRLVITTDGAKGIQQENINLEEFRQRRLNDSINGGIVMGLKPEDIFCMGISDGELESTVENIGKIVFHIRQFKPDIIITHNPQDVIIKISGNSGWVNHRDHLKTGKIACFASYPYSRDHAFFPEQIKNGLLGHSVKEILFSDCYHDNGAVNIGISDFIEIKKNALSKHFLPDDAESYLKENETDNGYFETLGYYKIY